MLSRLTQWMKPWDWTVKFLRLSKAHDSEHQPGLIMIQIDGFSKVELEKAIECNEMPFLKKLLTQEKYKLHSLYPGLPSTTPAVQGELFYGVRQAVPSFFFFDRQSQNIFRMFDGDAVREMESRLAKQGAGLLEGGSSYSNIYSGGAKETHFCAGSLGWGHIWKDVNIFNFILLFLTHFFAVVRMFVLCVWETLLALVDCIHGLFKKEDLMTEFKFICLRIFLGLLLRELVTVGVMMDIARGLPIIHLNFIGYDEQAHRREPGSKNAHWVLRGIDKSISRIYSAATHSHRRNYDVWVYSDHGQEATIPYVTFHRQTVESAVTKVFERLSEHKIPVTEEFCSSMLRSRGIQGQRARYLSLWLDKIFPLNRTFSNSTHPDVLVAAMGPLGGVYIFKDLTHEKKIRFAQELVHSVGIPLVLMPEENGKARAWNEHGEYLLPEDGAKIVSASHPFLDEVVKDLVSLCHHPNAGTLTISGWRPDAKPFSFPFENGAHAGPGKNETGAFALIPSRIRPHFTDRHYLRPSDLRELAMQFLRKEKQPVSSSVGPSSRRIRIMTYNVHSCIGMDGRLSPERVARVIGRYEPDIVALQELDMGRKRTGEIDQPHLIAKELEMNYHFYPSVQVKEQKYGNAILSRYPIELVRVGRLPGINKLNLEPRGAMQVSINIGGSRLQIINTHLALYTPESRKQAKHLVSEWINYPDCAAPIILCGDFNSRPHTVVWRTLNKHLTDAQLLLERHRPLATWFGHCPIGRIDHIFVSKGVKIFAIDVPKTQLDKMASDHLPLIADVEIQDWEVPHEI